MTDKYVMALNAMERMSKLLENCNSNVEGYKLRVEGLGGWAVNHEETIREALQSMVRQGKREKRECEICGDNNSTVDSDGVGLICCQPECKIGD